MNIYDNEITYKIREAQNLNVPSKLLYLSDDNKYYSLKKYIEENHTLDFENLYDNVNTLKSKANNTDVLMLYIAANIPNLNDEERDVFLGNLIIILPAILDDDNNIIFPVFTDLDGIKAEYERWYNYFEQELDKERILYEKIIAIQDDLSKVTPLETSDIKFTTSDEVYQVVFKNTKNKPQIIDGLDIFVSSIASVHLPFIQYNGEEEPLIKVYKGLSEDNDKVPLNFVLQDVDRNDRNDTFFITIHMNEENVTNSQNAYYKTYYSITKGTINIPSKEDPAIKKRIISRFLEAFPNLDLIDPVETKVEGEFSITGMVIDTEVLHILTINDPTISAYLYIDESGAPFCEKKRFSMHYRSDNFEDIEDEDEDNEINNFSSATITFPLLSESNFQKSKLSEETGREKIQKNKVHIRVKDRKVLNQFMVIFPRLMVIYMDRKAAVIENLKQITSEVGENKMKAAIKPTVIHSKIKQLKTLAPEIFEDVRSEKGSVYSRKCECPAQPIIIADDEIQSWKNKPVILPNKQVVDRIILDFPPNAEKKYHFVCPNDDYYYPYGISNAGSSNEKDFPYIPCCAKTDKSKERLKNFEIIKQNPPAEKIIPKSKEKYHTKSIKPQEPGRYGTLPKSLISLLQVGFKGVNYDFNHFGVIKSPSSFLHCLCVSVQDKKYDALINQTDREKYVLEIRKNMAKTLNLTIFKQEMYNYDQEQIRNMLIDPKVFLDPHLFYRGLEEYFNVNIYVFNPEGPANKIENFTEETEGPVLEIPRCIITHIRNSRPDRKTVIILKYPDFNQCELIISRGETMGELTVENEDEEECCVDKPEKRNKYGLVPKVMGTGFIYNFDYNMEKVLYTSISNILSTYSISYPYIPQKYQNDEEETFISPDQINIHHNLFPSINWHNFLNNVQIIGQKVDSYGKLRILQINYNNHIITLWVLPSQPLNLPIINEITSTTEDIAIKLLGTPSGITSEGVWFPIMDYKYAIFIPCSVHHKPESEVPPPPIKATKINFQGPVDELRNKQRMASILIQLLWYLWRVEGKTKLIDWWNKYVVKDDNVVADFPTNIVRILPKVDNSFKAILSFHKWWPTYFHNDGKVHLYSKLYDTCLSYLEREAVMTDGLDLEPPEKLVGLYIWLSDFPNYPKTLLFNQKITYLDWLKSNQYSKEFNVIMNEFSVESELGLEPLLYHKDQNMYIIQNVKNGELSRALALSLAWKQTGINRGYDVDPIASINIAHIVYSISKDELIVAVEDKTGGHNDYLEVLFTGNRYIGLLKLL